MRERFAEVAADMEMGYYVDPEGHQWDARPLVISQVMRHLGLGQDAVAQTNMPAWWPGSDAMRRIVALKVMLRQAQARSGAGEHPWLDPLLAASVGELLRRLYVSPEAVGMRELVDLTTKLSRLQNEQRRTGLLAAPAQIGDGHAVAVQRVTETILQLPKEEQERARKTLDLVTRRMQEALPAEIA